MLVHDHHAVWRGDVMHDEVNMSNHNAASDGGKSNGQVSGGYSAWYLNEYRLLSALEIGDERSCAAERRR